MNRPTRREFVGQAAAVTAGSLVGCGAADDAANSRRPNLVYVFADQLRYQSCGYAGDEHARTPSIDRLASEGANFRSAVSSSPVCTPYRASVMTGKYQSSTGMVINELRLSPDHECLGHVLTSNGYRTGYIGKWHLWANQLGHHQETINGFVPPGPYRLGFDGLWAAYNFNHRYFDSPYFRDSAVREIHQQYEPDSQTDMAIEFVRQAATAEEPFALFLSWGPPHDPWSWDNVPGEEAEMFRAADIPPRPNYSEQSDPYADAWATLLGDYGNKVRQFQRVYYAQTASVDRNLGRLMAVLEQSGVAGNTVVVFTSDHGEMFGAQGRRAKNIFYEEAARVPMLVRWPDRIQPGGVADVCMGSPDIMPTLLGLLDLPAPAGVEGMDLSGHALGNGGAEPEAAYMQGMGTTAAWKDGTEWRALRDRQHTYAVYRRDRRELLFDNVADPYQMKNLAGERSRQATLRHYRDQLQGWMKEQNDTFEACTWYRDHWTEDRNIVRTAKGGSHDLDALKKIIDEHIPEEMRKQ